MSAPTAAMLNTWANLIESVTAGYEPSARELDLDFLAIAGYLRAQARVPVVPPVPLHAGVAARKGRLIIGSCTTAAAAGISEGNQLAFSGLVFAPAPELHFNTDEAINKLTELALTNPSRCYIAFKEVAAVSSQVTPYLQRFNSES